LPPGGQRAGDLELQATGGFFATEFGREAGQGDGEDVGLSELEEAEGGGEVGAEFAFQADFELLGLLRIDQLTVFVEGEILGEKACDQVP
jgi:hypothetical protein